MSHKSKQKYIEVLKKKLLVTSGVINKSIQYKIDKLTETPSYKVHCMQNTITNNAFNDFLEVENKLLEGYKKIKEVECKNIEKINDLINFTQTKLMHLSKLKNKTFTGKIDCFEKINGELWLTINKTEFDPCSNITNLAIWLNNKRALNIDLSKPFNPFCLPLESCSKVEIILEDSNSRTIHGISVLPTKFFLENDKQTFTILFDIFHFITFYAEYKRQISIERIKEDKKYFIQNGHILEKNSSPFPLYCVVCKSLCSMFQKSYKCIYCNIKIHASCYSYLIFRCINSPQTKVKNNNYDIEHKLFSSSSSGLRYCCHCGERIGLGDSMLECTVCKDKFHKSCEKFIFHSCQVEIDLLKKMSEFRISPWIQKNKEKVPKLEDYELIRVLGKGGSGKVILSRNIVDNKEVALKVIKKESIPSPKLLSYIETERLIHENLSRTNNPFIAKLYYYFEDKHNFYLVLEYGPGGDLMHHCKKHKFSENEVKLYAAELILALEFIHKHGVAYRDLKLENILICADGHLMVCDFGFSKLNMDHESKTYTYCGTLTTIAPEVIEGNGYDKSVDFWSLGTIIFELFHKYTPFFGMNAKDIVENIKNLTVNVTADISDEAKDFIYSLIVKDPSKRLGRGKNGIYELKTHKWFKGLDWDKVEQLKIEHEYKPGNNSVNVDEEYLNAKPVISEAKSVLDFKEHFKCVL